MEIALDGQTNGTIANELPGLYIAEYNTGSSILENAAELASAPGPRAQTKVLSSLSDFLAANTGFTLDDLQGSWGVDPTTDGLGIGHSWAIVGGAGSGIFVVAPKPSTLMLMISGAVGLLIIGARRLRKR